MFQTIKEIETKYELNLLNYVYLSATILRLFNSDELNVDLYDLNNSDILNLIGLYCMHVKKNYEQMKNYYLMAINKGHLSAMTNLGFYYQDINKDYEQMMKYYFLL